MFETAKKIAEKGISHTRRINSKTNKYACYEDKVRKAIMAINIKF